ncbi:MAG: hypothetical protein H0V50_00805 [Thermoleophilaceae bacterium]|nr:hypothetical protein [Thermoleophilaceae bacterium]
MAAAHVAERANYGSSALSTAHVVALTNPTAITVGNHLIIRINTSGGATRHPTSITDPRGNTWTMDAGPVYVLTAYGTSIWSCKVATAYLAGDTLTLNSGTSSHLAAVVNEFSGLVATGWADKAATFADENALQDPNTFDTGLTATTSQADELLIGAIGAQGGSAYVVTPETLTPAWVGLGGASSTSTVRHIRGSYRIVAAVATYKYAGTLSELGTESTLIATYKATAAGGSVSASDSAAFSESSSVDSGASTASESAAFSESASVTVVGSAAIAHVAARGTYAGSTTVAAHSVALSAATATGNHLIMRIVLTGSRTITSIVDARGNTWQVDLQVANDVSLTTIVASCLITTAHQTGDLITVNLSLTANMAAALNEFSGLAASLWTDKTAATADTLFADAAFGSGATAVTAQADELLIGALGIANVTATATPDTLSPAWVALSSAAMTTTASLRQIRGHYRIVAAAGAYAYAGTMNTAYRETAGIVTYRAGGATGPPPQDTLAGTVEPMDVNDTTSVLETGLDELFIATDAVSSLIVGVADREIATGDAMLVLDRFVLITVTGPEPAPPPPPPTTPPAPVVPTATLALVLAGSHRPVVRLLFMADLETVLAEVAGHLVGGSVSMDRTRDQRRSANVALVNDNGLYTPVNFTSLVTPFRLVRLERGAYIGDQPAYVPLMTGLLDEPTTAASSVALSFSVWSRLRLADVQFAQPVNFLGQARVSAVVRAIAALAGLGTDDDWYSLDDGGATLEAPRSFDVSDNMLQAMTGLVFHHGLELFDDALGRLVLRPYIEPAKRDPVWDFGDGLLSLSRTLRGRTPVNRQEVAGVGPDTYPIRASVRDLNPASPTYNPVDGSGPLGDRPGPPYISPEIRTQGQANAVALRLLYEQNLADEQGQANAIPIPLVEAGDVVLIDSERVMLDTVTIPLGEGSMSLGWRAARSLTP